MLKGENLRFWLMHWDPELSHMGEWLLENAYMKTYFVQLKFTLPGPGAEIPNIWALYAGGNIISWTVIASGYGTFTEYAVGYTLGATGHVTATFRGLHRVAALIEYKHDWVAGVWVVCEIKLQEIGK